MSVIDNEQPGGMSLCFVRFAFYPSPGHIIILGLGLIRNVLRLFIQLILKKIVIALKQGFQDSWNPWLKQVWSKLVAFGFASPC